MGPLVEIIGFFRIKYSKVVIVVNENIFLDESLVYNRTAWSKTYPEVIKKIVDRLFKIRGVDVSAYDDFLDCNFFKPRIKFFIVRTGDIW